MIIEIFADGLDRAHIETKNKHISCRGVVLKAGKVLGEFMKKSDVFNLPGGGLEPGETLEACCVREIAEETGIGVTVKAATVVVMEYFPGETWESHFFRCETQDETTGTSALTPNELTAGLTHKWYDLYEFLAFLESYESKNPYGANIHQRELIGLLNSI